MSHPTFTTPCLTTFCGLDELGLEAVGQRLDPDRAVIECRVVDGTVNGAAHSQHCYGMAADISVSGQKPETVAAFARQLMPDWGGVGIYAKKGFAHIDVRETPANWLG